MDVPFYITDFFPMLNEMTPLSSSESAVFPEVLIESQNADMRFLLKTSLVIWNYEVLESTSFVETQDIINDRKPALILMDCDARLEEDLIKIRTLRKNRISSRIPIIVFSGDTDCVDHELFFAAGANEHLFKPLDFEKLGSLIDENINRSYQFPMNSGGFR